MVSWLEKLERREAAAREQIDELRARIEELSGRLAEQETVLSRLEITRETMSELLDDGEDGPVTEPESEVSSGTGSPVGVRLIPDWTPQLAVTVLPRAYQDIVEGLADAVHPMRAHQLCAVLGLSTDKSKGGRLPFEAEAAERAGLDRGGGTGVVRFAGDGAARACAGAGQRLRGVAARR